MLSAHAPIMKTCFHMASSTPHFISGCWIQIIRFVQTSGMNIPAGPTFPTTRFQVNFPLDQSIHQSPKHVLVSSLIYLGSFGDLAMGQMKSFCLGTSMAKIKMFWSPFGFVWKWAITQVDPSGPMDSYHVFPFQWSTMCTRVHSFTASVLRHNQFILIIS